MDLTYKTVKSMNKPSDVEFCDNVVYLRKDIQSEDVTYDDGTTATKWFYQEARLTTDEYKAYEAAMTTQLVTGQKNGDDNQLAIMEAIAFLYETIIEKGGSL